MDPGRARSSDGDGLARLLGEAARQRRRIWLGRWPPRDEETGYDNWDGGTTIWTVFLEVPEAVAFARLGERRGKLEEQITAGFEMIWRPARVPGFSASIIQKAVGARAGWRTTDDALPPEVRQGCDRAASPLSARVVGGRPE